MNLELPFVETDPATSSALDARISELDRTLDAAFLEAVAGELERLRLEPVETSGDAAA